MTGDAAYRTSSLFYPRADITWKGNSSLRCSLPSLPVLTLIRPNYQSLQLLWTPVIMRAHTHAVPDMHTLSTRIKTTCICTLSSWSEIYSRIKIKKKKKVSKPYMQLGLLMSEKCGIFIANSICIQYADLQMLNSLPKSLLSKLADSLHFPDEPEGTCWWAGDRALCKNFRSHLYGSGISLVTEELVRPHKTACFWPGYELGS